MQWHDPGSTPFNGNGTDEEKRNVTTPPEKDLNLPPPPEIREDLWESVQLYEMQMSAKKHLSKNVDADPLCGKVDPINVPHHVKIKPPHELDENGNELQGSDESGEDAENDEQPPTVEKVPRVLREIDTSKERGDSPPLPPPPAIFRDVYEDRIVEEAADRLGMNLKSPIALPGKEMMITADNVVECAFQEAISIVEKKLEMSLELSSQANVPMNSCLDANCGVLEEALDQPRVQLLEQDVDELCQRCAQIHIHENYVGDLDRIPRNVFQVEFLDFEELGTPLEVVAEGVTEEVAKTDPKTQASIEEESEDGDDGSCSRKYLVETASVSEDDTLDEKLECVELSELSESESSSLRMMVKVVEELTAEQPKDSEGHGAEKLENKWTEIPEPQKWEYFAQDNKIMGVVMEENADENCHNIAEENSPEEAPKVVDEDDVCGSKVMDDSQKSQDIGQKVYQPLEEWKMSHIHKSVIVEHEKGDDWDEECLDSPRKSSSDQVRPHFFSKRVNLDNIKLDEDIVPKFQEPEDINITVNAQCIFSGNVVPSLHCGSGIGDTDLSSVLEDKGDRAFDKGSGQSSSLSQSGEEEEEMGDEGKITSYLSATITAITDYESNSSDENQKVERREEQVLQDFRTCPNAVPPQIWEFVDEGHDRKSFKDVEVIGVSRAPAGPDSTGELVQLISKIQVCLDTTTAPTTTTTTTPGWETESSDSESDSETEQELYKLYRMPRTLEKENESEANAAHSQPPVDPTRPLFSQSWTDMMKEDSLSNYWDEKPISYSSETPNNRKKMGKGNKRHQKEKRRSSLKTIGTILTSPFRIIYNFFRKK